MHDKWTQRKGFAMSRTVVRACSACALRLMLFAVLLWPMSSIATAASSSTAFSGRATVVSANAPVVGTVVLSDTGALPSSGGSQEASLLNASVPGLLTAETLHAATVGQGDRSRSEASVASLTLTPAGHTITADFLMSRAMAICTNGAASASGSSELVALVIDNQSVVVSGAPNQTVKLPDGTGQVVINEQKSARPGDITVNALHVTVTTPAGATDVVIASAHADITCPPPGQISCTGGDFVTGGGWIPSSSSAGAKDTLAVAGGIKQGGFWGHLQYIDHATGMKVRGTGVTAYVITGATSRHIDGTAEIDGMPGTYQVDVADNGEPGRGVDRFAITLSNGYTATGTLGGGNIQLHQPCV
jgi:hypothetical protein